MYPKAFRRSRGNDRAYQVAQNPNAPNDERRDAITQTARQVAPDAAGLNISADDAYRLVKAFSRANEAPSPDQARLPKKGVAKVSLDLSEEAFYALSLIHI